MNHFFRHKTILYFTHLGQYHNNTFFFLSFLWTSIQRKCKHIWKKYFFEMKLRSVVVVTGLVQILPLMTRRPISLERRFDRLIPREFYYLQQQGTTFRLMHSDNLKFQICLEHIPWSAGNHYNHCIEMFSQPVGGFKSFQLMLDWVCRNMFLN